MERQDGFLGQMVSVPYHRPRTIAPGVELTFLDAGHVLGSAIVVLDIDDSDDHARLVFTGDLGRRHLPILRDPEVPDRARYLLMESTYGDRLHDPIEQMTEALGDHPIVRSRTRAGGVVRAGQATPRRPAA